MPVILTQHFSPSDRVYEDAEFSLYHFPRIYFSRVRPYDRFIYYRPLGKRKRAPIPNIISGMAFSVHGTRTRAGRTIDS